MSHLFHPVHIPLILFLFTHLAAVIVGYRVGRRA